MTFPSFLMNYNIMVSHLNDTTYPKPRILHIHGEYIPWYDYKNVTSTMDIAMEFVRKGCICLTAVTAHSQSSGRGTHGRDWSSRDGKGLWLSVILPPPHHFERIEGLSILIAKTLVDTLKCFADCRFTIKHPNDVMVNNRKIAGILVETATKADKIQSMVLGMGVNFCQTDEDFAHDNLFDATSLFSETGTAPDRTKFLVSFLEHLKISIDAELYVKHQVCPCCCISQEKKK